MRVATKSEYNGGYFSEIDVQGRGDTVSRLVWDDLSEKGVHDPGHEHDDRTEHNHKLTKLNLNNSHFWHGASGWLNLSDIAWWQSRFTLNYFLRPLIYHSFLF